MQPWHLRPAVEADAPELCGIEAACFGEPWSHSLLTQALRDPKYLLLCAQSEGALIGYAAAWSVLDEGQIDRLAVLPTLRRQGIGRALLAEILDALRGASAEKIFLEVRANNASAIELYRAVGFEVVGRSRRYYSDGEDALILRLEAGE